VRLVTLSGRDAVATALTALAALTYLAATQPWDVWLVGSSYRWAAGAILVLGLATCSLGSVASDVGAGARMEPTAMLLSVVGACALAFGIWALASGSRTPLSLLIASVVALWAASTLRHAWHGTHRPVVA
jgi:hypothetical protein